MPYSCGYTVSALCQPVSWPAKCHTKMCLFLQNKVVGHMTYSAVADMSAGLIFIVMCMRGLSSFLIIHPDLVLMTLSVDGLFCLLKCLQFLVCDCYL